MTSRNDRGVSAAAVLLAGAESVTAGRPVASDLPAASLALQHSALAGASSEGRPGCAGARVAAVSRSRGHGGDARPEREPDRRRAWRGAGSVVVTTVSSGARCPPTRDDADRTRLRSAAPVAAWGSTGRHRTRRPALGRWNPNHRHTRDAVTPAHPTGAGAGRAMPPRSTVTISHARTA